MASGEVTDRLRSLWEQYAPRYDRDTGFYDLLLLGDSRSWACSQASGHVLEVAIGSGRNLPFYPRKIQLTGIDFSPAMLDIARDRAAELALDVNLLEADAQHLPFADDRFDTRRLHASAQQHPRPSSSNQGDAPCASPRWSAPSGRACRKPLPSGESWPTTT
jgi:ubiquinone/menaquinone biosynthesis C-methylase UbiE